MPDAPVPASGYSPVLCRQCRRTLARLFAGNNLSISIRCPKCKTINVVALGVVRPCVARAEAPANGLPIPKIHRLAGN